MLSLAFVTEQTWSHPGVPRWRRNKLPETWNQKESLWLKIGHFRIFWGPKWKGFIFQPSIFSCVCCEFQGGKYTHFNQFIDVNQWLLAFFCKGSWVFVYFRVDHPADQLPHPSPSSLASPPGTCWRKEGATLEGRLETCGNSETKNRHGFNFSSKFHVTLLHRNTKTVFLFFFRYRWIFLKKRSWFFFQWRGLSWACCFCAKKDQKGQLAP